MKNRRMEKVNRSTGLALAAAVIVVIVIGIAACSSGPRVNKDGYFEPDIHRTDAHNGHVGFVEPGAELFGVTTAPDGADSYFVENAKTKIQDNFCLGNYEIITWTFPVNVSRYTRYEFDIAFDNRELVEDIDLFYFKLQNENSFYQWDGTSSWRAVKERFLEEPTVFQTISFDFSGPPLFTDGPANPKRDVLIIFHRFMTATDEMIPGKIYIRGNRFFP